MEELPPVRLRAIWMPQQNRKSLLVQKMMDAGQWFQDLRERTWKDCHQRGLHVRSPGHCTLVAALFFLSTTGSDSNNGTSQNSAFSTFALVRPEDHAIIFSFFGPRFCLNAPSRVRWW